LTWKLSCLLLISFKIPFSKSFSETSSFIPNAAELDEIFSSTRHVQFPALCETVVCCPFDRLPETLKKAHGNRDVLGATANNLSWKLLANDYVREPWLICTILRFRLMYFHLMKSFSPARENNTQKIFSWFQSMRKPIRSHLRVNVNICFWAFDLFCNSKLQRGHQNRPTSNM